MPDEEQIINQLLQNNRAWAAQELSRDPEYFSGLADAQHPKFLWIGCSDSRVPPNIITGTEPGDMFVHRNIANLIVATDMNMLSVLQYAVEVLQVQHVIVCGHYGCGGVKAAMGDHQYGLIDNWLRTIKDTQNYYWAQLKDKNDTERFNRMVELNVIEQVHNLGKTNTIQNSWSKKQYPFLHGWVYDIHTGHVTVQAGMINGEHRLKAVCKFEQGIIGR